MSLSTHQHYQQHSTTNTNTAANPIIIADEQFAERQRMFEDFLNSETPIDGSSITYRDKIATLLKTGSKRLIISINDVRNAIPEAATGLLQFPLDWLPPLEVALREVVSMLQEDDDTDTSTGTNSRGGLHIGFVGSFGALHRTPRHLSSQLLNHMVLLDGIVTSCSLVRPKLLRSVHWSNATNSFTQRIYWDGTMITGAHATNGTKSTGGQQSSNSTTYPTMGDQGEKLHSQFGLSEYQDYQTISMQEMPERAPAGQLPRSVDVVMEGADLVDSVKPGDRVRIAGVYKSLMGSSSGAIQGAVPNHLRTVVIALNVTLLGGSSSTTSTTNTTTTTTTTTTNPTDQKNIKTLSKRDDIFELLSRSLAPSIYGHEYVKKAVLLMLLGGVEKNLEGGTHLRGDINLMLVGDPSTAKSQMLRFVLGLAPLAIATTGRGSSGVGLTAAVTSDKETGERRLEAGAMVLADRGIVCIDEFDKMSDADRVAIHEVMEQQTVTIAKAGIHASLNARCSVLAAANPIWGQYRESVSPQENIRLPDSLLSRFDLLFIILDKASPEGDRNISRHVLQMHRSVQQQQQQSFDDDLCNDLDKVDISSSSTSVFQRSFAPAGDRDEEGDDVGDEDEDELVTVQFLKEYIAFAKSNCTPILTPAAIEIIVEAYTEFRQKPSELASSGSGSLEERMPSDTASKTFPVTPRTLETLIRLSTAHAKCRLSRLVDASDAIVAKELLQFCLYKEVIKKSKKNAPKRKRVDSSSVAGRGGRGDDDNNNNTNNNNNNIIIDDSFTLPDGGEASVNFAVDPQLIAVQSESQSQSQSKSQQPLAAFSSQGSSAAFSGTFVDAPTATPSTGSSQMAVGGGSTGTGSSRTKNSLKRVRLALHRMRSLSSSAVFACTMDELKAEVRKAAQEEEREGEGDSDGDDGTTATTTTTTTTAEEDDDDDINASLLQMQQDNQIMLADGNIFII